MKEGRIGHRLREIFAKQQEEPPHVLTDLEMTIRFPEVFGYHTEIVPDRKIIPFRQEGVNFMIYEDNVGITHLERDYRVPEVSSEGNLHTLIKGEWDEIMP